jgi:hypothetical protein
LELLLFWNWRIAFQNIFGHIVSISTNFYKSSPFQCAERKRVWEKQAL